ncbi:MAG: CCA tRNA nucleotidyltransferase, partial [Chloroflexi bacterium]|nr:CCA tRNA nucleotidyltransferase [Chloroflexota bacterium]
MAKDAVNTEHETDKKKPPDFDVTQLLIQVSNFLAENNVESYVVGGFVRDTLLGRATADIDVAVATDATEIAPKIATVLGGTPVLLDRINKISRVVFMRNTTPDSKCQLVLDLATFTGNIEQDLARRDFTIDAMAIDLAKFKEGFAKVPVIDPFGGRDDLRHGKIRAVSETIFESDPVRLLRAVRLAAELNFRIEKRTEALAKRFAHLITGVAGERIREELLHLLNIPGTGQFLAYLDELGLLTALFPELIPTKGVEQPKEHFWKVFEHCLKTVNAADFLLRQGDWQNGGTENTAEEILQTVPWSPVLAQHFYQEVSGGSTRQALLKLAALFHDIAKPQTKAIAADGRTRFLGHAEQGATIVTDILERLKFSTKEIKYMETMITHHLRPSQLSQVGLPTRRALYRYFRDTGETGIDVLFLNLADHLATRGPNLNLPHWREHTRIISFVISQHFEQQGTA